MELTLDQALQQAIQAHKLGKLEDAQQIYQAILGVQPQHPDANHNLGVIMLGVGKSNEALSFFKVALQTNPKQGQYWISYIDTLINTQEITTAKKILEEGKQLGLSGEAVVQLEQKLNNLAPLPKPIQKSSKSVKGKTKSPSKGKQKIPQKNSGPSQQSIDELLANYSAGHYQLAEQQAKTLTQKYPRHPFGWKALGLLLKATGKLEESLKMMHRSIEHDPKDAESYSNIGATYKDLGRFQEAQVNFQEALRLKPNYAVAHNNLGNAIKELGFLEKAQESYREAIRLEPNLSQAHNNLGNVLKDLGRLEEAQASYREALRLKPDYLRAHSNLLFSLNYVDALSTQDALQQAKRYGSMVSSKALPKFTSWQVNPDPVKLRVGLVSGDLRNHPVGYFVQGLIENLDNSRFELFAFPTTPKSDELTTRIQPYFEQWLPIYDKNDLDAATLIHQKAIHILIDLSGHTAHNRLPVFSYKPAPIQVSWLGYFATTGLPEMDYFLGDPCMSPQSEEHHFTEKVWRLAQTWFCLTPPPQEVPVAPLPALSNGYVTFGCFGNLAKMGDQVINCWVNILQQIPQAKLFLKANQLADAQVATNLQNRFASQGIPSERLILEGPSSRTEYLNTYNRIDLVLDTFPYPGGTTSCEALWMGVPVLTLKGGRFLSHLGESIVSSAGQTNWIAQDLDDYVKKAVSFAGNLEGLTQVRTTLRDSILQTPLFDTACFSKHFEEALWGMWDMGRNN